MAESYQFNVQETTATLAVWTGFGYFDLFVYDNDVVSIEGNHEVVSIPVEIAADINEQVRYFERQIAKLLFPASVTRGEFEEKLESKNGKLEALFKHGNQKALDATFDPQTGLIEYKVTPNITMNFYELRALNAFVLRYENAIKTFTP